MRVHAPGSLKLSRRRLLAEVRERLQSRAPDVLEELDPSNPAWVVLEEAAWMVESLSGQLDEYPFAVVRQFAHLLGAQLQPAQPALGVLVAQPAVAGLLRLGDDPARWRFFTPQTESHGLVEFALAEEAVPVHVGEIRSVCVLRDGELYVAGAGTGQHAWLGEARRSRAFASESVRYSVLASDAARLEDAFRAALKQIEEERRLGWIQFGVARDGDTVHVDAHIRPEAAFRDAVGGLTRGGDLVGHWGALDDTTWTPPVRVSDHPLLPRLLKGIRPLPGDAPGTLMVPEVPPNVPAEDLLVRDARPAPLDVVRAIWTTLVHADSRLAPLRPTIVRSVGLQEDEPEWVTGALRRQAWYLVADGPDQTLAHVRFPAPMRAGAPVRVGWVLPRTGEPRIRVFALHHEHGVFPEPLPSNVCWDLPLPDPEGRGLVRVVSIEALAPPGSSGLLVTVDGVARGALLNPLLVINAPVVRDGRTMRVERAIPDPVTLVHSDVVDRSVLEQLVDQGIPASAADLLRRLPLARFSVDGAEPIRDFAGVQLDSAEGTVVMNAPSPDGITRKLRRGDTVRFDWYRRTDAEAGNVAPLEIRLVEQAPSTQPRLSKVVNPLATSWGAARETDGSAVERIFGPQLGVPVTPADWERLIRTALGTRAENWMIRVWSHAERALVSHALWPLAGASEGDQEREQLAGALARSGPETLLVVLGPTAEPLDDEALDWARQVVNGLIASWTRRLPVISRALVARLWPLRLRTPEALDLPTPAFGMRGLSGALVDPQGRTHAPPRVSLLLNGAIVRVEVR